MLDSKYLEIQTFWSRYWQPTPVFLSGEFHGQRNLAGYSPWGLKELDTTETYTHTHLKCYMQKSNVLDGLFCEQEDII